MQVGIRIETALATALDDGVEDGAAFPGLGLADKQPIFLTERGGADGRVRGAEKIGRRLDGE